MLSTSFIVHLVIVALGVAGIYGLTRHGYRIPAWWLLPLALFVLAFEYFSFRATFPIEYFWDFVLCYYPAGEAVVRGDMATLTELYQRVVQGFVNMPAIAWLFAPFSLLAAKHAAVVFTLLGIAASAGGLACTCPPRTAGAPREVAAGAAVPGEWPVDKRPENSAIPAISSSWAWHSVCSCCAATVRLLRVRYSEPSRS